MISRIRNWAAGICGLLALVIITYLTGAAGIVRRTFGLPSRNQIVQLWIHRGSTVTLRDSGRRLVFLITGQSNAGNYGRGIRRYSGSGIYNAYHGRLYLARDPLLGSDGLGISPWIPFAETLLQRGAAQSVVLALAVGGGMGVREWNRGGPMRAELFARVADLQALGLAPDFVLWQQGESDAFPFHTSPEDYAHSVRSLVDSLRQAGISAPILIVQATRNFYAGPSDPIRDAQARLVDPARGMLRGPDTDQLGPEFRYDGVHFSEAGITALSQMWVAAVLRSAR